MSANVLLSEIVETLKAFGRFQRIVVAFAAVQLLFDVVVLATIIARPR